MILKKKCLQCKANIEVDTLSKYKRKYCKKCSEKRKKMWDEQWKVKFEDCDED
jgi:uncharacterized paraquat-inducible protein A